MTETTYPTYDRLIALLDEKKARYRVIEHVPEGHTELISPIRGNPLSQAAKCIIVMVKPDKKTTKHVLVVVPGDMKIDFKALKEIYGASYCSFASVENAERLGGSVVGTILPFSFHPDLELVADPKILETTEMFFNAARLDRSLCLTTEDYRAIAAPRVARVALAPA
ncbi:MAG TPA: YbaK/EbsC family protein [Gemmatimonadales bacterium]|jgi:Ala-tRNA(Pro) deacylase|nr:YbaK/EbsC family protein [Gemmatimonadales bacterium]